MGDFTLEDDDFKTPQWDLSYRENILTDVEYLSITNTYSIPEIFILMTNTLI